VVKPGDIVRVKVLEVDASRKRIALTLRLDDELGARPDRVAKGAPRSSDRPATASSPARKAPQPDSSGGGALAEALRRAAEKNGSSKTRPR
jgi:uncharacterized protein